MTEHRPLGRLGDVAYPVRCVNLEPPGGEVTPTTTDTDSVEVRSASAFYAEFLAPGRTSAGEGGSPEIELVYAGTGHVGIELDKAADSVVAGTDADSGAQGVNINAGAESAGQSDIDLSFAAGVVQLHVQAGDNVAPDDAPNVVSAAGNTPFESPLAVPLLAIGGEGPDTFVAGSAPSGLLGWEGNDRLIGGAGDDDIVPGLGDDLADGGPGTDEVNMTDAPGARVDLRVSRPQDTGEGMDTIRVMENAVGSGGPDVLIGTAASNALRGGFDDDRIKGLGGDDRLSGGTGTDRITGGRGDDLLTGGYGAGELLFGNAGIDLLFARDFRRDLRLDCGPGRDEREHARIDPRDPPPRSC